MAIAVFIVKRPLSKRRKNGQRRYRYALRWEDAETGKFKCETCATSDRTEAEGLQKLKWAEVNGLTPKPESSPPPPEPGPSWEDCRDALQRAMQADNCRPSYVDDAMLTLDGVRAMFPEAASPADITSAMANEWKRRRSEASLSPWTIKGDLAALKAVFGKWLGRECGLLDPDANPFASVSAPKCDDPDVLIVSAQETAALFAWMNERWNNWRLPLVYLEVAALVGWRATEIASMRTDDLLADGFVRVQAQTSKTRKFKYGWLPPVLHAELASCQANGWAFGRFTDELRRLLILWRKQPHHASRVQDEFAPERLVGWLQDELQRFNEKKQEAIDKARKEAAEQGRKLDLPDWETFTLHDFRRTAITAMQMSGVSEKEASVLVGATPEVIRRHYEKLDQLAIARRSVERRLSAGAVQMPQSLRAGCARQVDDKQPLPQTVTA